MDETGGWPVDYNSSGKSDGHHGYRGIVEMYQGKPEIKVLTMSQIKGADSQAVAQRS